MASRTFKRSRNRVIASAALCILANRASFSQAASLFDGFESFASSSGTTVTGYSNWTTSGYVSNTGDAKVYEDGTGYAGSTNYLRLYDPNSDSSVGGAKKTLGTSVYADGATMSFALRADPDGTGLNNDQVKIYAGGSLPALQCGIQLSSGALEFSYTPYNGTAAGMSTKINGTVANDTWYLFTISYAVNQSTLAGTYMLAITDGTNNITAGSLAGQSNLAMLANEAFASVVLATSGSGVGNADFDALSISNPVPESACIGGIALATGALSLRRRHRLPVN